MRSLLVLTSSFPRWPGDTTTPFVAQFAAAMAQRGRRVLVVAPHFVGAARRERVQRDIDVRRFRYFLPYRGQDIAYGGNAVSRIARGPVYAVKLLFFVLSSLASVLSTRTSVINAHWLIPQGFVAVLAKALTGRKVVVTVHGGDVFSLNGTLMRRIKRFVLRRADEVVVNSSATRAACTDLYDGRRYAVIPMGVDTDRFAPRPKVAGLVEAHSLGGFTVLFVGRLTEDKGVAHLLQALAEFKSSGAAFTALIIGAGDQEAELRRYVADDDLQEEVRFLGWVDSGDLPGYYNSADVFVGPSVVGSTGWQEALGLVFVEALASGLPVIATNTGGIGDVVQEGVTGFLVDQRAPGQIADRLATLYRDPRLRSAMSRAGREFVENRFSWSAVGDAYAEVFDDVTGR
jgi:glycosyltransferase involved in cell wall biosynthesis